MSRTPYYLRAGRERRRAAARLGQTPIQRDRKERSDRPPEPPPEVRNIRLPSGAIIVRAWMECVEGLGGVVQLRTTWRVCRGAVRTYRSWRAAWMAANR